MSHHTTGVKQERKKKEEEEIIEGNKGDNWHKTLLFFEVKRVDWISSKIYFIFSI